MSALFNLKLYTTSNCHLCELALDLTRLLVDDHNIQLIEISEDINLLNTYETLIPVVQRTDTSAEIKWPFTKKQLRLFLK
jgi:hypothetical protein